MTFLKSWAEAMAMLLGAMFFIALLGSLCFLAVNYPIPGCIALFLFITGFSAFIGSRYES